jgi:hypothetical protein
MQSNRGQEKMNFNHLFIQNYFFFVLTNLLKISDPANNLGLNSENSGKLYAN